jgi:hypothetical protein
VITADSIIKLLEKVLLRGADVSLNGKGKEEGGREQAG